MVYTNTGKIKGKRYCVVGDNKLKHHLMRLFATIVTRCYDKNSDTYKRYGAKGIGICDEWIKEGGFDNFYNWAINNGFKLEKMSNRYNKWTIDRIDNNKGYSPENCRWVDIYEQAKNKNIAYWVEYRGEKDTLINFCRKLNLDYHPVYLRIKRRGWSVEKALSTPIEKDSQIEYNGKIKTLTEIARDEGLCRDSLKYQYIKNKKDIYKAVQHFKGDSYGTKKVV